MTERESLTRFLYYLHYALQFAEDYKRDCKQDAKHSASQWVNKLKFVLNDVFFHLTPAAKERFREEISQSNDPLFLPAITEKILRLGEDRREMLETMLDGLLTGEEIIISHEETK
jgi:hypothetical protein